MTPPDNIVERFRSYLVDKGVSCSDNTISLLIEAACEVEAVDLQQMCAHLRSLLKVSHKEPPRRMELRKRKRKGSGSSIPLVDTPVRLEVVTSDKIREARQRRRLRLQEYLIDELRASQGMLTKSIQERIFDRMKVMRISGGTVAWLRHIFSRYYERCQLKILHNQRLFDPPGSDPSAQDLNQIDIESIDWDKIPTDCF